VALSFRLTPGFLPDVEYPNKPFGLFFIIGEWTIIVEADMQTLMKLVRQ
jgi:hypothetical protein